MSPPTNSSAPSPSSASRSRAWSPPASCRCRTSWWVKFSRAPRSRISRRTFRSAPSTSALPTAVSTPLYAGAPGLRRRANATSGAAWRGAARAGFKIALRKTYGHRCAETPMCAPDELGLGSEHAGLLILDPARSPSACLPINEALPRAAIPCSTLKSRPTVRTRSVTSASRASSRLGFARTCSYPADQSFAVETHGARSRPATLLDIRVDAPADCPLYIGIAISGVKVGPSPAWLQERLKAVGLRPINNLVDVGNYVMLELGQPLHVFDAKKIGGHKIVIRHAAEGEKLTTARRQGARAEQPHACDRRCGQTARGGRHHGRSRGRRG